MIHAKHDHRSGEKEKWEFHVNGRPGIYTPRQSPCFHYEGDAWRQKGGGSRDLATHTKVRGNKEVLEGEDFMKHTAYQHAIESAYLIEFILAPLGIVDDGLVAVVE
jgi:hypothetical protein